jgi:uncharacterized protein (TIGR00255 family)
MRIVRICTTGKRFLMAGWSQPRFDPGATLSKAAVMSVSGMTGFGRAEVELGGERWVWEVRSVNGRTLDLKLKLPQGFDELEPKLRAAASQRFKRGSLQGSLSVVRLAGRVSVEVDAALVEKLLAASAPYVASGRVTAPSWDGLLNVRGVLTGEEAALDEEARAARDGALLTAFERALEALSEARRAEGRNLADILNDAASRMDALIDAARASAAAAPAAALARIRQRLEGLAPEIKLDPQRLAQEAALAAMRADVQEELERLSAHVSELRALLTKPEPAGRKLDFLAQELTREANTLCSKSSDLELTRIGLDLKTVVDQVKEQAANVE